MKKEFILNTLTSMKNLLFILLTLILFSCSEKKEVYETEIKTYTISYKKESCGKGGCIYYIYFQTPTSTECAMVNYDAYSRYEVGQKIQVLIKYWEKPKKK